VQDYLFNMNWDEKYRKGEVFWDKGAPSPAMKQYLEGHAVRGLALVPGCGRGAKRGIPFWVER
jgi:hypothetical protein